MERCTVVVDARDRFSTTAACLRTLLPSLMPHPLSLKIDRGIGRLRRTTAEIWQTPKRRFRELTKRRLGHYNWTTGVGAGA